MVGLLSPVLVTAAVLYTRLVHGQLIGPVGPTTPLAEKTYECDILDYGAVADNVTDVSTALQSTFEECVLKHPGSRLVVPAGNYLLNQSVVLSNGTNWAFQ
jgi:rhamnogalacturonan hydrolase